MCAPRVSAVVVATLEYAHLVPAYRYFEVCRLRSRGRRPLHLHILFNAGGCLVGTSTGYPGIKAGSLDQPRVEVSCCLGHTRVSTRLLGSYSGRYFGCLGLVLTWYSCRYPVFGLYSGRYPGTSRVLRNTHPLAYFCLLMVFRPLVLLRR